MRRWPGHDKGSQGAHPAFERTRQGDWRVGGFRLLRKIGQGGMGTVYKAYEESLNRVVALKLLPAGLAAQPTFIERFQREARAMAKLTYPNIVSVYQVGQTGGHHYIAMEYVGGPSLEGLLAKREVISPALAVKVARHVGLALSYAHKRGVLHRDLKPSNMLLTEDLAETKVADFGLARILGDIASLMTGEGQILGTPYYMSPEQVLGKAIDPRADLYSLGVVLYEMLCGKHPYEAGTPLEVMRLIADSAPRPLPSGPQQVPPHLRQVVDKAIRKDRAERYSDVEPFLEDLSGFQAEPAQAKARPAGSRKALLGGIGLVGALVLAVIGILAWPGQDAPPRAAHQPARHVEQPPRPAPEPPEPESTVRGTGGPELRSAVRAAEEVVRAAREAAMAAGADHRAAATWKEARALEEEARQLAAEEDPGPALRAWRRAADKYIAAHKRAAQARRLEEAEAEYESRLKQYDANALERYAPRRWSELRALLREAARSRRDTAAAVKSYEKALEMLPEVAEEAQRAFRQGGVEPPQRWSSESRRVTVATASGRRARIIT